MMVQIVSEVSTCNVQDIKFAQKTTVETYNIGDEQISVKLPSWKMPNGCDVMPVI